MDELVGCHCPLILCPLSPPSFFLLPLPSFPSKCVMISVSGTAVWRALNDIRSLAVFFARDRRPPWFGDLCGGGCRRPPPALGVVVVLKKRLVRGAS